MLIESSEERPRRHLLDLPPELLHHILRHAAPWHLACPFSEAIAPIAPPQLARVCLSFLHAIQSGPLALRLCTLRLVPSEWSKLTVSLSRPSSREIDALAFSECNIRSDTAKALLRAASSVSHLAVLKCHSLSHPLDALALPSNLTSLCLSGADLGSCQLGLQPKLVTLSLVECTFSWSDLIDALPHLPQLRLLMLGGARITGTLSPAAVQSTTDNHTGDTQTHSPSPNGRISGLSTRVRLIEVTFLEQRQQGVIAALCAHFPGAEVLDFSGPCSLSIDRSLQLLRRELFCALGANGERAADEAIHCAINCRTEGPIQSSPLHLAAISGDVDLAACLLRHCASPNLKDSKGCTALHRALFWGHTRVVEMLLSTRRCDTSSANHAMERPLYIAALRGHPACLKLLLDVEPTNAPRNYHDGYTPLHAAVIGKSLSCLQLLLRHGFEANASNRFGQTALHLGARLGGEEAARILLAHSANCILRDERGHTALQVANSNGHHAVAEQLSHRLAVFSVERVVADVAQHLAAIEVRRSDQGAERTLADASQYGARCLRRRLQASESCSTARQLGPRSPTLAPGWTSDPADFPNSYEPKSEIRICSNNWR
ncbi:MAG: hypothetical protein SGPRY_007446 [Prymnesium sp.]